MKIADRPSSHEAIEHGRLMIAASRKNHIFREHFKVTSAFRLFCCPKLVQFFQIFNLNQIGCSASLNQSKMDLDVNQKPAASTKLTIAFVVSSLSFLIINDVVFFAIRGSGW